jgi:hypothetical protein
MVTALDTIFVVSEAWNIVKQTTRSKYEKKICLGV